MSLAFFDNSHTPSQAQIEGDLYAVSRYLQTHRATILPPSAAYGYWGSILSPTAPSQMRTSIGTVVGHHGTSSFSASTGAGYES